MEHKTSEKKDSNLGLITSILVSGLVVGISIVYSTGRRSQPAPSVPEKSKTVVLETTTAVPESVELPVRWGDMGARMVTSGVINKEAVEALYATRGGMTEEMKELMYGTTNGKLRITEANASFLLNLLWGLGLGNKNSILEKGPMTNPAYGGAGNFASTGGWTLAQGGAMQHYSRHEFFSLSAAQQEMVERVAKNIYRPCCDNSTHFPDCNHGMAMLGLLELMASQDASEKEMYDAALVVNSFWFPSQYRTIARALSAKGISPAAVDSKMVLGAEYSSVSGFRDIAATVPPEATKGGGGCGI